MGSGSPAKPTANAAASLIDRKSAKRADFRMDSYAWPPISLPFKSDRIGHSASSDWFGQTDCYKRSRSSGSVSGTFAIARKNFFRLARFARTPR